jgi:hypothetical protein
VATDLTLYLDDQPGELANLGQALGRAEVNVEGFCAVSSGGGQSEVHVLVEDAAAAFAALNAAGIEVVGEQEVAVVGPASSVRSAEGWATPASTSRSLTSRPAPGWSSAPRTSPWRRRHSTNWASLPRC